MASNESSSKPTRYRLDRRRLLQLTGVGVGSLTMATMGGGTARAADDCVEGPTESTFQAETINLSQIATGRKNWQESDGSDDPTENFRKRIEEEQTEPDELPPAAGAQQAPDANGLLDIGTQYDGIVDIDIEVPTLPSDSQIAVNRSKVVQVINSELAIFNQRSGEIELRVPFENLFEPLITEENFVGGLPKVGDPRVRYDPNAKRFVISTLWRHFPSFTGAMFLAVSDNRNPNGTWHLYRISPAIDGLGFTDYPVLGLDRDAIYLTELFLPIPYDPFTVDVTLAILDKHAAYRGDDLPATQFTDLLRGPGIQWAVQPAFQPFSGGQSGTYYLMSSQTQYKFFGEPADPGLTLWEVTDPLGNPSVTCTVFRENVEPWEGSSDIRQPNTNTRIDTDSDILMNLDYNDGSLWTAHTIGYNWDDGTDDPVSAIRWYEVDPTVPEVIQSGTYGEPGTFHSHPRIESAGDRTLMAYTVSGPNTFPSIEIAGRTADTTTGEMEDAVVVQEGQSSLDHPDEFYFDPINPEAQWGDYKGISIHPTTGRFWVTGQYSPDFDVPPDGDKPDEYQTHIAEVSFNE